MNKELKQMNTNLAKEGALDDPRDAPPQPLRIARVGAAPRAQDKHYAEDGNVHACSPERLPRALSPDPAGYKLENPEQIALKTTRPPRVEDSGEKPEQHQRNQALSSTLQICMESNLNRALSEETKSDSTHRARCLLLLPSRSARRLPTRSLPLDTASPPPLLLVCFICGGGSHGGPRQGGGAPRGPCRTGLRADRTGFGRKGQISSCTPARRRWAGRWVKHDAGAGVQTGCAW